MTSASLAWHEFRYERLSSIRDPQALFFAIGLPLLYVVIFVSLFGNERIPFAYDDQPGPLKAHTTMLAGFVAIAVVSATFFNLAVTLVQERESGILKRFRGTPLPTAGFIAGHVGTSIVVGIAAAGALLALGRAAYGIPVPLAGLPALLLVLLVSSAAFCCLAFAFTLVVRKAGAAMPLGTGVTLALYFLSGNS
jgi:ABC-2 type transport system permease protein